MKRLAIVLIVALVASASMYAAVRLFGTPISSPPTAQREHPRETKNLPGCKELNKGKNRLKNKDASGQLVLAKIPGTYKVLCVVDGDTFDIEFEEKGVTYRDRVRVLGFNSPETVDKRAGKGVQCYGQESSQHAKELLTGKVVTLKGDKTQFERDNFHRLVAYVYLADGTLYNLHMLKGGYGQEYTFQTAYERQAEFRAAEAEAYKQRLGVWKENSCALESAQKNKK